MGRVPRSARLGRAQRRHLALIRRAVEAHGGMVVRTEGDACFAAFAEARAAAAAAGRRPTQLQRRPGPRRRRRSGWACTRVRRTWPATTTAGSKSTARLGSPPPDMAARSSCRRRRRALIADDLPPEQSTLSTSGPMSCATCPRPERLGQLTIAGLQAEFPPLAHRRSVAVTCPDRLTSFLGRDAELALDRRLLATDARLVTLTGPGGIGKSSLADRGGARHRPALPGRGMVRAARRGRRSVRRGRRPSPTASGCSTARSGRRPIRPASPTSPSGRCCWSSTTSSTC